MSRSVKTKTASYDVVIVGGGLSERISENHQRLNTVDFEGVECDAVTVTVNATNGAENAHIYEIRICLE